VTRQPVRHFHAGGAPWHHTDMCGYVLATAELRPTSLGMRKPVKVMTDPDVIQVLGQPDEIVSIGMMAEEWTCST